MQTFHEQTNITLKKYYSEPNFIDYTTQPQSVKRYPHFYRRFFIDDYKELGFIKNIGKITYEKSYGKNSIALRTNPSAGGLYPCEVYIQIRGIKGFISGIYHYEPLKNALVLIHELTFDGLEAYTSTPNVQENFIFLVSCAYFRTTWKYGARSHRYLLLDCGHQLGTIYAALQLSGQTSHFDFNFDKAKLNERFCFEGFEFFLSSIKTTPYKDLPVKELRDGLVQVCACDYQIREPFIESFYQKSLTESYENISEVELLKDFTQEELQKAIDERRSARAFKKESITKEEFLFISQDIFDFAESFGIELYMINHRISSLEKGLYKNVTLKKSGNFEEKATHLALNQMLAGKSALTLFFTANNNENYSQTTILCGFIAHILYLKCAKLNIGCSAIGAYFDTECQQFLETKNNILYLVSIGR